MDIKALIRGVLEKGHLMSLATVGKAGVWVSDVIYIFDEEFNLYWMSDPDVRHSEALLENPEVAGTITISNKSKEPNLCIQFSGIASKIEGARFDLAKKHLMKRGKPEPQETDDILEGDSWYMLKPRFFDLIDEEHFKYEKQKITLN